MTKPKTLDQLLFPADRPIQRGTPQSGEQSGEKRIKGF